MPTALRLNGFAVRIHTNDHNPANVHVVRGRGEAKVRLGQGDQPPSLVRVSRMSDREAAKALEIVKENNELLIKKWSEIHGW
jgi:hypothetical protein